LTIGIASVKFDGMTNEVTIKTDIDHIAAGVGQIILGKPAEIRLMIICLLARGHLLIEDIPGVGKTTLSQTLAKILGLEFNRIQFTSDLLPSDILGVSIFDRDTHSFRFHPGPVFTQVLLADELNRATPRTQSALLEAMEEQTVSVDGITHMLPSPFFVIATQNQRYHVGTFPLPESQLDRFLMRLHLGYPDPRAERELLLGESRQQLIGKIDPILDGKKLEELQDHVRSVFVSPPILDYIQEILLVSRSQSQSFLGLSPRAGISLTRASQAAALTAGRSLVLPEDVQLVAGAVLEHRLDPEGSKIKGSGYRATETLINAIPVR